uniref:Uncharacterized protein n=1 Tax=Oryza barthii TaxID=65489 RepID=A0A0D3GI72_9ORYZ
MADSFTVMGSSFGVVDGGLWEVTMMAVLETGGFGLDDSAAPLWQNRSLAKVVRLVGNRGGEDRCGKGAATMTSLSAMIAPWGAIELPPSHSLAGLSR